MNAIQRPDIGLLVHEGLPTVWCEDFGRDVCADGVKFSYDTHPGGPYAGLALYLPTAIGIFIASSYFGGAFKKLGEDHYTLLKAAALRLWRRVRELPVAGIGSKAKTVDFERYQLSYSITCTVNESVSLKLILRMDMDEGVSEEAIVKFLDMVKAIHLGEVDEALFDRLLAQRPIGGVAVVTFDPITVEFVPAD